VRWPIYREFGFILGFSVSIFARLIMNKVVKIVKKEAMKTHFLPFLLLIAASTVLQGAPRLTVSTPSFVPEFEVDVVFEQPMVGDDLLGKEVENKLVAIDPLLSVKIFWKA